MAKKRGMLSALTDPALSELQNVRTFDYYFNRLSNIAMSIFEWENLPDTVDPRFLELSIYRNGMCLFFKDDILDRFDALPCMLGGTFDTHNVPLIRRAYAANGYQYQCDENNSVIIYHNYMHGVPIWDIEMFATRLADYQRTEDVNVRAQKTPVLCLADDDQKAAWENIILSYEGNVPLMLGNKSLSIESLKVLKTDAPFTADKIEELRVQVWNDAMSYLGVSNVNVTKKERLITDEVQRNMGGVLASRYSPLEMRKQAANRINAMFGLDVNVKYREDILAYQSDIIGATMEDEQSGEGFGDE